MLRAIVLALCVSAAVAATAKWHPGGVGNRFYADPKESKVVGGEPTRPHDFPYQVSFQYSFGGHFCGGVIMDSVSKKSQAYTPSVLLKKWKCLIPDARDICCPLLHGRR
jgi:hypothetical protein